MSILNAKVLSGPFPVLLPLFSFLINLKVVNFVSF